MITWSGKCGIFSTDLTRAVFNCYREQLSQHASIGLPAKRHLNGVLLVGRWWPEVAGMVIVHISELHWLIIILRIGIFVYSWCIFLKCLKSHTCHKFFLYIAVSESPHTNRDYVTPYWCCTGHCIFYSRGARICQSCRFHFHSHPRDAR